MADIGRPLQFRLWQQPKRGEGGLVCEDAAAGDPARGCFAVADGAAESAEPGRWARLLVEEFVREPTGEPRSWAARVTSLQQRWALKAANGPVGEPWYTEAKRKQGAFATFLGLVLEESRWFGRKRWRALAVGDSCLFQVRQGRLLRGLPVARADDFGNAPWLLGSAVSADQALNRPGVTHSGDRQPEDRFWLMTDALAQWFLRETEAGGRPWETLEQFVPAPDGPFMAWVEGLRDERKMRNDDVTLLAVYW